MADGLRSGIRTFLRIDPPTEQSITITAAHDFETLAFIHNIWYRGEAEELSQYYRQAGGDNCLFWAGSPTYGLEMRRVHTGLPRLIVDTITDIVLRSLNSVTLDDPTQNDIWEQIDRANSLGRVYWQALASVLIVGDGAFKISIDESLADPVIIEWVGGDRVSYEYNRGRLTAVVFSTRRGKYTLREVYGRGYVRYTLLNEYGKEVPLSTVTEYAGLVDVEYTGDYIMAVPFRASDSMRFPGRGESVYAGKLDSFDSLDETWSQWMQALRSSRPIRYIPRELIPRDPNTGRVMRSNPYDNSYIAVESNMSEGADNKITVSNPAVPSEQYLAAYITALDLCLQGIISPSTLGVDVKKLDNAEAQREKEKTTLYTRNKIIDAYDAVIKSLIDTVFKVLATLTGGAYKEPAADIVWSEYSNPSFEVLVQTLSNPNTPMSVESKVEELWGDSKDETWKAEEVQRIKDEQGALVVPEPSYGDGLVGYDTETGEEQPS